MTNPFAFLRKTPVDPPIKVKISRDLFVRGQPYSAGDEAQFFQSVLSTLDRDDYQQLTPQPAKVAGMVDPSPIRPTPEPVPSEWKSLPACFTEWWNLREEFRTAREHLTAIYQERKRLTGLNSGTQGAEGPLLSLEYQFPDRPGNVIYHAREIDLSDPETRRLHGFFATAITSATDFLERLRESRSGKLLQLRLECGLHRLAIAEKLQPMVEELWKTGFDIFATRVAALGLHEMHVRRLYLGSADHARFNVVASSWNIDRASTGIPDGEGQSAFADEAPTTSASRALAETARIVEIGNLLKAAKSELSKAQKAAMPAGLAN